MEIKKLIQVNELLDIYSNLLTEKQKDAMFLYYQENLSFGEIGEELGISRQAVYDTIKKSEQLLYSYEENLGIQKIRQNIDKIKNEISDKLVSFKGKYELDINQVQDIDKIISFCEEREV